MTALTLSMAAMLSTLSAATEVQFPVPRAQAEFARLGPHVRGYCRAIEGSIEGFRRAVLPFGPMDLAVSNGTGTETEALRNLYLGFVGAACKVDAAALAQSFHCGVSCTGVRENGLVRSLQQIKDMVRDFRAMEGIDLLSQWGVADEFRVDNVFVMMSQTRETKPSPVMGFIPSDIWTALPTPEAYLNRRRISEVAFRNLLGRVKALSLAAVVREKRGVRVVRVGISNNESGLLVLNPGTREPAVGENADGGRRYVVIHRLETGVVFYETN